MSPDDAQRAHARAPGTPGGQRKRGVFRALGLGVVTGACDDDCSAIGTYASAGAKFGPSFLWTAPVTFPMMFAVVYLSSKLGQVSGKGLFDATKDNYPRWLLWPTLVGVLIGNTIEAAADLGGMAAAINLFVPVPIPLIVVAEALVIVALQVWGSYELIRNVFRWLALALLAYVGSGVLAKPHLGEVLWGTFVPTIEFSGEFLAMLVAVIGTTLSAYLCGPITEAAWSPWPCARPSLVENAEGYRQGATGGRSDTSGTRVLRETRRRPGGPRSGSGVVATARRRWAGAPRARCCIQGCAHGRGRTDAGLFAGGGGPLGGLMHRALKRGDATTLAALRAECARRTAAEQEMCRREWIRQCSGRRDASSRAAAPPCLAPPGRGRGVAAPARQGRGQDPGQAGPGVRWVLAE
jgi:hypothetical protein